MDSIKIAQDNSVTSSLFLADGSDFDPQTMAMLQAFYSRSTKSIEDRTDGMDAEQVRKSLHKYYIGYGHRSIGQCGNFVLFLEDVSIFAAKAIQNHPLYNGQETSTRYYDFSTRPMILPQSDDLFETYIRTLYTKLLAHAYEAYLDMASVVGVVDDVMERTCKAKAFDLARSVLTGGFTTKLSWSTNFEQAHDHLETLVNSPVAELSKIGMNVADMLHEKYPQATPEPEALINWWKASALKRTYFDDTFEMAQDFHLVGKPDGLIDRLEFSYGHSRECPLSEDALDIMRSRKRGQNLPRSFTKYGTFNFNFNIDYGSYRDLHRHRNGLVYFPSYYGELAMHPWYMQEIASLGIAAKDGVNGKTLMDSILHIYSHLLPYVEENVLGLGKRDPKRPITDQETRARMMYYVPMGTMVRAHMRYDLPQAIYVAELRSARTVHATARIAAKSMADAIKTVLPFGCDLFVDDFEGLSRKRGEQTILERSTNA